MLETAFVQTNVVCKVHVEMLPVYVTKDIYPVTVPSKKVEICKKNPQKKWQES